MLVSTANPNRGQIERLDGFRAAILEGHSSSKTRVINNLESVEHINVSKKHSVLYRAISSALSRLESDTNEEFKALPAYMALFAEQNEVHIRFNTVDKFEKVDVRKDNVNQHIMRLQSARTVREYERNIETLKEMFPVGIPSGSGGKPTEEFVWTYLQKIHPTSWTVLGNSDLSEGETAWLKENWKDTSSYGSGLPLFGKLFDAEQKHVAKLTVLPSQIGCFYVFDPFDRSDVASATKMFETNMISGKCRPCRVSEQLEIPCRHIQAVLFDLERRNPGKIPVYNVLQYFHPAYLVRNMRVAMCAVKISLPVNEMTTASSYVLPAPRYRQAGGTRRARVGDNQRGEKRILSRGEEAKLPSTKQQCTDAIVEEGYDEHDATPTIYKFFASNITSASTPDRGAYYCTKCNKPGHNARTCRFTSQEVEEAGVLIVPGVYVLGESPLKACRLSPTVLSTTDSEFL
ncbi:uncharacterized protein PITG_15992 [Phytophthora infestans T30-4]|uniref:CCHC-type domain-containing protein n=1 Tax=Phytophthora infestans (strain T30-4) TaxID=403677 RepID=D0NSL5_PHYIT|nr:uncharacterized protein PITG_15992 [Phytophthora infestans T30-4]EEY64577.1 conserved hypothetical protein [Phytophthora infestans T30-4]|eukprot:XP_002897777.1 conserved hypothetical protein [Phytophthora infestans T30-4]